MHDHLEANLPDDGILVINRSGWGIEYPRDMYMRDPEYSSWVSGDKIEQYITALLENWREFERLKATIPGGVVYRKSGTLEMDITIGGRSEGIRMLYEKAISNKQQLDTTIESLRYAAKRGPELLRLLESL